MPNNQTLNQILFKSYEQASRMHYDEGSWGNPEDECKTWLESTGLKAQIVEAITQIIGEPIEYVKIGKTCPACSAPHMYQCTCDSGSEYTVNMQQERARTFLGEFLESSNDQE